MLNLHLIMMNAIVFWRKNLTLSLGGILCKCQDIIGKTRHASVVALQQSEKVRHHILMQNDKRNLLMPYLPKNNGLLYD
jgi:hypothetical protein